MDSRRRRRCRLPASNQCFRMNNRRTAREGIASQAGLNCHGWRTKVASCRLLAWNVQDELQRNSSKQARAIHACRSRRCLVSCNKAEHNAIFWAAQSSQTQASAPIRAWLIPSMFSVLQRRTQCNILGGAKQPNPSKRTREAVSFQKHGRIARGSCRSKIMRGLRDHYTRQA